jgi:hypothetical protein
MPYSRDACITPPLQRLGRVMRIQGSGSAPNALMEITVMTLAIKQARISFMPPLFMPFPSWLHSGQPYQPGNESRNDSQQKSPRQLSVPGHTVLPSFDYKDAS